MTIGRRIKELRLARNESLQDVATAVGVSKAHIWELEKGRTDNPSIGLVTRIADHFDVSIRYMIDEDIGDVRVQREGPPARESRRARPHRRRSIVRA